VTTKKLIKLLALYLPYILLGLVATNIGEAWRLAEGKELGDKIMSMMGTIPVAFATPLPSLHPLDLLVGLCCGAGLRLAVYLRGKNAKKYRHGMEYGSARWGTPKDIEPFMAPKFADNIILTKTERLMMSNRPPDPKNARNKNVLVVGGSGSGKTRFWLKPNLLQCHSSYVVTDPKGTVVEEVGRALVQQGHYKLKILNTIDFSCSMHYNPFHYLHSETDILSLVTVIMENTQSKESKGGDDFWSKAEALLYQALIAYIYYEAPEEEKNMTTLLDMLNACECREDDENFKSAVDLLFEQLEQRDANHFAVRQYKKFKMAAGKTLKSILISCGARLAPFDIQAVREMMEYDELELEKLGEEKIALFAVVSDSDPTFNFISAMMYSQMFNVLCNRALTVYHGRLPVHVTCLFDEFANQKIPNWEHLVSVIRSRNISAHIVLQTYSQLKGMYRDNAETIAGCCSSLLFLGGKEESSLKMVATMLGKETIDTYNTSDTRGTSRSYGLNYQKLGKELKSVDELAVMPSSRCILQVQGVRPFYSRKYDLTRHPMYRYTADANPKYTLDVKGYLAHRLKVKPEDEFEVYDLGEADSISAA
jgi:type IV secretion system protein VirD4